MTFTFDRSVTLTDWESSFCIAERALKINLNENGKYAPCPTPLHEQPISCVVAAESGKLSEHSFNQRSCTLTLRNRCAEYRMSLSELVNDSLVGKPMN